MSKGAETTALDPRNLSSNEDVFLGEKLGTSRDVEDMKRMGKEQLFKVGPQRFPSIWLHDMLTTIPQRNFGFLSIFGFAMILVQTWQALLGCVLNRLSHLLFPSAALYVDHAYVESLSSVSATVEQQAWSTCTSSLYSFFSLVNASMAEMASIAPTAGRSTSKLAHNFL